MRLDPSAYRRIVVLTGAGVSAGSCLRTYRGPGGVWDEHDVARYGHVDALNEDPAGPWRLFGALRSAVVAAQPNAAHCALAAFEARLAPHQEFLLVTQNVDGLHQRAGSRRVVELHGNLLTTRCTHAGCSLPPFHDEAAHDQALPRCPRCGAALRADIVLFGEALPADALWQSKRALRDCDLFLAIGTSGVVTPAASFVRSAEYAGARTVLINLEPMDPPHPAFQEEVLGRAEEILPGWLGVARE